MNRYNIGNESFVMRRGAGSTGAPVFFLSGKSGKKEPKTGKKQDILCLKTFSDCLEFFEFEKRLFEFNG